VHALPAPIAWILPCGVVDVAWLWVGAGSTCVVNVIATGPTIIPILVVLDRVRVGRVLNT
jgi:hypothetical protein